MPGMVYLAYSRHILMRIDRVSASFGVKLGAGCANFDNLNYASDMLLSEAKNKKQIFVLFLPRFALSLDNLNFGSG